MDKIKLTETEIAVSNGILANLFDRNQDAVVISDLNLNILYFNKSVKRIPLLQQKIKGGSNLILLFPELSNYPQELRILKKSKPAIFLITIDRSEIEFSASPMVLGEETYIIFLIRKKGAIDLINRRESIFKPLVQQSPIATAIFSPGGKPIYINKAYGELFSISESYSGFVFQNYNLFQDEQLIESGLLPFVEKSLEGETVEIPTVLYNPVRSSVLKAAGMDIDKYVKGSIFPVKNDKDEVNEIVVILTDVTFQKQAEQILTEAHLKFQMLNLNLPGAIYEYERKNNSGKGKFIYMSQGCQEIFGVEPELIMKDEDVLNKLIHPDDIDSFNRSVTDAEENNAHWEWEGRILIGKELKWVEAKSSLRIQPDGRHISYGVLLDVTEKKKAEEQYKKTEERLRMALHSADISLWEWEENIGKVYLNANWASKFGFTEKEVTEYNHWKKMVHPEDLPIVEKCHNDLISGAIENFEVEYRIVCKNSDWFWILDKGKIVERNSKGKVTKIVGTQVDINERKLSEAIIKKNEQLFTQLFENAPLGIVLLDEKHKVVQMNKGFEDLFGYSRKDIIGNALNKIVVPRELLDEAHDINVMTSKGKVGKLESIRKKKNGEFIPVIIYGVPVLFNKKTIGIYGIYVDISDRKKAERELQIRNDELDNFVYKVSHDLRAPLSSILGLVNLAHIETNHDDPKEYINLIGQRVRQLDSFISDVLSHSKNLKLEVSVDKIPFKDIICKCFKDLNYLPGAEKIKHKIKISGKDIYSDPWRINEIFRNLISNAIKYRNAAEDNPYISIEIRSNSKGARLTFSDNGIGIDKDHQKRIFEMFFRATTSSEGSGIGLYIVKNAVEKLGGRIKVMSKPKKGTTFEILLPNLKARN